MTALRFCGSRTPGPVGTSGWVKLRPIVSMLFGVHAQTDHLGFDRRRAALGQGLVIGLRADRVGVARDDDPNHAGASCLRRQLA